MSSRDALWARLRDAGTVSGDPPPFDPPSPWYVRALLGAAGWLAALCLLGFVAVAGSVLVDTESMAIVAGIAMIGGAAALLRPSVTNPFVTQLGMAVSCAGQALVIFGTVETIGNDVSATVAIAVFEAALAALVPNYVHRVLSAAAAAVAMTLALTWLGAYFLAAGLLAAIAAWLWSREFEWGDLGATMRPIAYGVTLALVGVHGTWIGSALLRDVFAGESTPQWFPRWLGLSVATLVLAGVVVRLLRGFVPGSGHSNGIGNPAPRFRAGEPDPDGHRRGRVARLHLRVLLPGRDNAAREIADAHRNGTGHSGRALGADARHARGR
jgi:hypothetical protein